MAWLSSSKAGEAETVGQAGVLRARTGTVSVGMDWEKGSRGLIEKHRCYLRTDCNGERREEESITMIGYCDPFHNKLCFPLGPSKTG